MKKIKVKELKTWKEKVNGLTGIDKIEPVYFETRFGIHTFGMKQPIDVYILDKNYKVVSARKNMKPQQLFFWNPKYSKVLEVPTDFIDPKIAERLDLELV